MQEIIIQKVLNNFEMNIILCFFAFVISRNESKTFFLMKIHYYFDFFTVINSIDCQVIQNSVLLEELTDFKDLMKAEISYINLKHNEVIQEKEKEILSIKTELSLVQFLKTFFPDIYIFYFT